MAKPPADLMSPPSDLIDNSQPPADLISPPADLQDAAEPSPIGRALSAIKSLPHDIGQMALGVVEQPAAGLGWLGAMGVSTVGAAVDMALNKVNPKLGNPTPPGMSAADRFIDESNALYSTIEGKIPFAPETQSGKDIMSFMVDKVLTPAMQGVGDLMYAGSRIADKATGEVIPLKEERAAGAGAIGQAMTMLAILRGTPEAGKEMPKPEVELTGDPVKDFATKYPKTAMRLEASAIGDSPFRDAVRAKPTQHIMRTAEDALNKELGITPEILAASPEAAKLTVGDKIKMVIQRAAGQAKEPISINEQQAIANAMTDQLFRAQQQFDAMQAAVAPKKLPAPSAVEGPITVDSKGLAVTMEQWGDYGKKFDAMSPEQRAVEMGIGPMGVLKKQLIEADRLQRIAVASEKPIDAKASRAAQNALKQNWASIFSNPKDTGKRAAALEQYVSKAGEMTYDEAIAAVGERKATAVRKPKAPPAVFRSGRREQPASQGEVSAEAQQAFRDSLKGVDTSVPEYGAVKEGKGYKQQRGILDISDLGKDAAQAKRATEDAATKGWLVANPELVANGVKAAMEKNRAELELSRKRFSQDLLKKARRGVYAHDYDVRSAIREAGPLGEIAHARMVVQNGATMAAKVKMDKANAAIFDPLTHAERTSLDEVTRLRRIIQIDKYKGVGVVRHEEGITGPEAAVRLEQMQRELGAGFDKINDGATSIFEQQKILLTDLLNEGLISQESYAKMKDLSYTRTEYLDAIDPAIPIASHVRNMPLSIRSSGIPELGHGKKVAVNIDAQQLLMEDMARVENRIFRNRTLQAVRELAIQNPENGIVRIPPKELIKVDGKGDQKMRHTPQGWTSIGVRHEGKQEFILMRDEFAEQFVARPEAMPEWLAVTLRTVSGTSLIKTTSTAHNPGFIAAGIPMDIFHTWLSDTKVYSPHLPVYLAQIGVDMMATAKDAFTKKGAWEQAMSEGIGSSYLTHESRSLTDPSKSIRSQMSPHLAKTKTALSYLNDTTDMWLRLAYRNRLMREGGGTAIDNVTGKIVPVGLSSWEATAVARDRLDYYQGGHITKAFDTVIPYANVAVQGPGKVIEAGARDPGKMATKAAWLVATAASATLANMIASPETHKAIAVDDKVRNFNITFGDQYFTTDQNGNKRYMYAPIRIDQTAMPLMAAVVGGLEKAEYGEIPDGLVGSAFGQVSPVNKALPIPLADAIASYVSNYDTFTGRDIYTGPPVLPQDEVRTFGQGKPTSPLAVGVGGALGASPMRLEVAAGKLINTNNFYIQMMGGANKLLFQGTNPRDQAASTMLMLQEVPGLRNVIKLTSPGIADMKAMKDAEEAAGSKVAPLKAGLDDLLFQFNHKQNGVTTKTIETYINNQPQELRQQLADHFKYGVTVDKILSHYEASAGIPNRAWWIHSSKLAPEVRGQVFYNEWVSAKPEDRKRMLGVAQALSNAGIGYRSEGFDKAFAQERHMLGDEER